VRFVMFYHSLISDWNHGNAHFLRGVVTELLARGHEVSVYEPRHNWSLKNLLLNHGEEAIQDFQSAYPHLKSTPYDAAELDLHAISEAADVVIVHEWNDHDVVRRLGEVRAKNPRFKLLFHDTHHRSVTQRESMAAYDLKHYDGVLAFGGVIRDLYLSEKWARRAWTWHEAADTRIFRPRWTEHFDGDLVWIGNWGDDERTAELHEFLLGPVKRLGLKARIYGVRYPEHAKQALRDAGIEYGGWLPNFKAPEAFARYRVTVHVPRRPYMQALPGIPTIRPFEALACGIPLISAPWQDSENLFEPGKDFLIAQNGRDMDLKLATVLRDGGVARQLALHGLRTIQQRHTCAHRVDELLKILDEIEVSRPRLRRAQAKRIVRRRALGSRKAVGV